MPSPLDDRNILAPPLRRCPVGNDAASDQRQPCPAHAVVSPWLEE